MRYHRIIRAVRDTLWAIQPERLLDIVEVLALQADGHKLSPEEIAQVIAAGGALHAGPGLDQKNAAAAENHKSGGAVQVLSLRGIIAHRIEQVNDISGPGGTSMEGFRRRFREAMNNPDVGAIVIDVDSPGGAIDGVPETADEMFSHRGTKPVIANANTLAASAAYWLASAADQLTITPSGEAGSIGIYAAHEDISAALELKGVKRTLISAGKHKVEGNPFEPLTEEAREYIQSRVDEAYDVFIKAVARNRDATVKSVKSDFGEGRTFSAKDALAAGMVDRIETFDDAVARARKLAGRKQTARSTRARALALSAV